MKVYFLSSIPCALTLNGAYFGITDAFERFAEISLNDNLYAQFSPQNALPIGCFLTQNLRFSPPEGFEVYLLEDGIALYARDFPPRDFTLKTYAQARDNDTLVTLFSQGELQLSIEHNHSLAVVAIPRPLISAKLLFINALIGLETKEKLALYTRAGECVFYEDVLSYTVENEELNATLPLSNCLGRTAECRYELTEFSCRRISVALRQTRAENGETTEDKLALSLLPFAFLESVLLGIDYTQFLSKDLLGKAETLRAFLGEFVAVVPTRTPNVCGLVRQKADRLYEVASVSLEITDGKITDIRA